MRAVKEVISADHKHKTEKTSVHKVLHPTKLGPKIHEAEKLLLSAIKKIKVAPLGMKKVPAPLNMKVKVAHPHLGKAIRKLKQE
jgi:hypothetical protein